MEVCCYVYLERLETSRGRYEQQEATGGNRRQQEATGSLAVYSPTTNLREVFELVVGKVARVIFVENAEAKEEELRGSVADTGTMQWRRQGQL